MTLRKKGKWKTVQSGGNAALDRACIFNYELCLAEREFADANRFLLSGEAPMGFGDPDSRT